MDRWKRSPYASWASVLLQTALEPEMDSNFTWIGSPTWFGRPCLPSKVVPRRRTSLGIFKVFSISFGRAPTWDRVPRMNIRPTTMTQLSAETVATCCDALEAMPMWYWGQTRSIWSSAHRPQTHSGWRSYGLPNEVVSCCRWTECSTLMDLHFEICLVHGISILYHHHHCS